MIRTWRSSFDGYKQNVTNKKCNFIANFYGENFSSFSKAHFLWREVHGHPVCFSALTTVLIMLTAELIMLIMILLEKRRVKVTVLEMSTPPKRGQQWFSSLRQVFWQFNEWRIMLVGWPQHPLKDALRMAHFKYRSYEIITWFSRQLLRLPWGGNRHFRALHRFSYKLIFVQTLLTKTIHMKL